MGIFVTETGFVKKTFEELKTFYETQFQTIFGADIDLDPSGPIGQIVALFAQRDTELWEGAEEIYNSRNPNAATGVSLDNIASETGTVRQAEGRTFVYNTFLYGTLGTTIPAGSSASQASNGVNFSLENAVTIAESACREIELEIGTVVSGTTYTIGIDGTDYSYEAIISDDEASVLGELKSLIEAGTWTGSVVVESPIIRLTDIVFDFAVTYSADFTRELIAAGATFIADETGAFPVPAQTLNTIVTPVSGWDEVLNPASGITGRERETDIELRIRRKFNLVTGNATEGAILNAVLNNVTGVSTASILSNRTDVTDVNGLPPHSFEVVLTGGDVADIAEQIWITMPAGIASYGNVTETIIDSQGQSQDILFSRPTAVYITVVVQRDLYSEEAYPADGDTQIKQAIVDWAATNQTLGKDVIRNRLSIPIYSVPGVGDINILIDSASAPGDPITPSAQDIAIAIREYADFAVNRITVEDMP